MFTVNTNNRIPNLKESREGGDMMKSKRTLAVGLVAVLSLVAAACGDDEATGDTTAATGDETSAEPTEPATTEPATTDPAPAGTKVGLLFDLTGRGDKSFNDSAAAGLDQATAELGITPSESAPSGDDDRAPRMDLMIADGQNLVVGVGFLWGGAIGAAAAANPDTHFAIVDSVVASFDNATPDDTTDDVALNNVASLVFAEEQGSFLVGAAAAAHASMLQAHERGSHRLALGVVAPRARQRAALHEHRRAKARAIVHREALHIEDQAGEAHGFGVRPAK